jgi:hypothetical protein
MQQEQARPSMNSFGSKMKASIERYVAFFLALVLLGALWSTALGRLSEKSTAETLLTRAGTDIINPLLTANNSGIGQDFYQQLQTTAKAHPNDALPIGFLKLGIPGKDIVGKSFTDGSRAIYASVADTYYRLGPNGVFSLPPQLQQVVSGYTPFVQGSTSGIKSPLPSLPIPQLPSFASQLYTGVGITPTTLTAEGHATTTSRSLWLWLISGVLALLLVLMNTGWNRLWSVAWPLFHASWHIALFGLIGTVLVNWKSDQAKPYLPILTLFSGNFLAVFYVAAVLGIALVVVSMIGNRVAKAEEKSPHREATPVLAGNAPYAAATYQAPTPTYDAPAATPSPYGGNAPYYPPSPPYSTGGSGYPTMPPASDGSAYPPGPSATDWPPASSDYPPRS